MGNDFLNFECRMRQFSLLESACNYLKSVGNRILKFSIVLFYVGFYSAQNSTVQKDEIDIHSNYYTFYIIYC